MARRRLNGVIAAGMVAVGLVVSAQDVETGWISSNRIATSVTVPAGANPPALQLLRASRSSLGPRLAMTPPMGWNGYNHFRLSVSAATIEAEAHAMVSSGMKAAGYTYVNLDGGWNLHRRNYDGSIQPDPTRFPHGIKPVADYVHSLGLKFGMYASAGYENCAKTSAGSYGHYRQDAATFAAWGVDYLKLDWCHIPYRDYPGLTHKQVSQLLATQMRDALVATGRPIVYDVNGWSIEEPWTWAPVMSNMWRTAPDIEDRYPSMLSNFTRNVSHDQAAGPGGWNDPDMLEVGNGGMNPTEYRSHFSLWSEMAAPLIAGNDLTAMSATTRSILTNLAVIAVDQDPLGRQGHAVASADGHWVLTKILANGDRAVLLFNQTDKPASISTTVDEVGLTGARQYTLLDLWSATTTETTGAIRADVAAHGVVFYRITASRAQNSGT